MHFCFCSWKNPHVSAPWLWPRVAELLTKSTYVRMDNNHDGEAAHVLKELHINVTHSTPARFARFGCWCLTPPYQILLLCWDMLKSMICIGTGYFTFRPLRHAWKIWSLAFGTDPGFLGPKQCIFFFHNVLAMYGYGNLRNIFFNSFKGKKLDQPWISEFPCFFSNQPQRISVFFRHVFGNTISQTVSDPLGGLGDVWCQRAVNDERKRS